MGHFAHITNITPIVMTVSGVELSGYKATVDNVIRAEQDFIDSGAVGNPSYWIQTSYNNNIRGTYAGIGFCYDSIRDIFYPVTDYPEDGNDYFWDEQNMQWIPLSGYSGYSGYSSASSIN